MYMSNQFPGRLLVGGPHLEKPDPTGLPIPIPIPKALALAVPSPWNALPQVFVPLGEALLGRSLYRNCSVTIVSPCFVFFRALVAVGNDLVTVFVDWFIHGLSASPKM